MNIKRVISAASAGLLVALAVPAAAFAATTNTYELGGTATNVTPGLSSSANAVQTVANSTQSGGGNIIFNNLDGVAYSNLSTLSADYEIKVGDCGGGAPRFYTMLDTDGNGTADKIVVYYFTQDNASCGGPGVRTSGNLAEAGDPVQLSNIDGTNMTTTTVAGVKALFSTAVITETSVVGDAFNVTAAGQTVVFDNVQVNDVIYTFEANGPKPAVDPKDACKKGGFEKLTQSNGATFKNQGACVSYVAKGGTTKPVTETQNVSLLSKVANKVKDIL